MFSTAQADAPTMSTGSKYLDAGINENVTFKGFTGHQPESGAPFLEATFGKVGMDEQSDTAIRIYMSPAAQGKSLQKVKHLLVDGMGADGTAVDAVVADTLETYATALNKFVKPTLAIRQKFTGEERQKSSGDGTTTRKGLGLPPFVEPMTVKDTKLKYDKGNKYDFTPMATPDAPTTGKQKDDTNDLPF